MHSFRKESAVYIIAFKVSTLLWRMVGLNTGSKAGSVRIWGRLIQCKVGVNMGQDGSADGGSEQKVTNK